MFLEKKKSPSKIIYSTNAQQFLETNILGGGGGGAVQFPTSDFLSLVPYLSGILVNIRIAYEAFKLELTLKPIFFLSDVLVY